ncbi:CCR4-NOT transcription complex subunit 11 [Entamoeba marina]
MPTPQHILDSLNLLSDDTKSLDQIQAGILRLVPRSEVFGVLSSLSVLLESQLLNQSQSLALCYVLSKHASVTVNPFFKVLYKKYQQSEGLEKDFLATLFVSSCPKEKSVGEIITNGKLPQVNLDLNALNTEYEHSLKYYSPSITSLFPDPDVSVQSGKDKETLSQLFATPIPPPFEPPQKIQPPILMEPGHDELCFILPQISFQPLFNPICQMPLTATTQLREEDKETLMELLDEEDVTNYVKPKDVMEIVESNKDMAIEILKKIMFNEEGEQYIQIFQTKEITFNTVMTVKELLVKLDKKFCVEFAKKVCNRMIKEKETNKRFVRGVCDFLETFIRMNLVDGNEANNLYKLLLK